VAPEIHHSRRHCSIQRRGQDFDKKLYLKGYTAKRLTDDFLRRTEQSVVLISCRKSCGTHAQFTGGQAAQTAQY